MLLIVCSYWNPNEFNTDLPTRCTAPYSRCVGGQFHTCSPEYKADYCASCNDGHYIRDGTCVKCVPEEARRVQIVLYTFVVLINLLWVFGSRELACNVLRVLSTLRFFRQVLIHQPMSGDTKAPVTLLMHGTLQVVRGHGFAIATRIHAGLRIDPFATRFRASSCETS